MQNVFPLFLWTNKVIIIIITELCSTWPVSHLARSDTPNITWVVPRRARSDTPNIWDAMCAKSAIAACIFIYSTKWP